MVDIRITQQFGRIGLEIKHPRLNLEIAEPRLEMNTRKPRLNIHSERPKIEIDQSACFADMSKRNVSRFGRYLFDMAYSMVLEAVRETAEEGDYLAGIENGNSIPVLAHQKMYSDMVDYNVGLVPEHKPEIRFITTPVQYEFIPGDVTYRAVPGYVKGELDWGKVEVYMVQKPFVQIDYVGKRLDKTA